MNFYSKCLQLKRISIFLDRTVEMDLNGLCMTFAPPEKLQGNVIFIFYVGNFVIPYLNYNYQFDIINKLQIRNTICYTRYRPRDIELVVASRQQAVFRMFLVNHTSNSIKTINVYISSGISINPPRIVRY